MAKLKLLILDANIVIYLHELKLWPKVLSQCEVFLSRIVKGESCYHEGDEYDEVIDLAADVTSGRIQLFDVGTSDVKAFKVQFDPSYTSRLDDGEAESLAFLISQPNRDFRIASADGIVYEILGNLGRSEQGISLEEILNSIGLGRKLDRQFTKAFREQKDSAGKLAMAQGYGKKN